MSNRFLFKELSRYQIGTWADIVYRNALLSPNREAFAYGEGRVHARLLAGALGSRPGDIEGTQENRHRTGDHILPRPLYPQRFREIGEGMEFDYTEYV